jgi:hypothetical protein
MMPDFVATYESATGAIFGNDSQELNERVKGSHSRFWIGVAPPTRHETAPRPVAVHLHYNHKLSTLRTCILFNLGFD